VAKTGGTKADLVTAVSTVGAVAVDDQYLYWTEPTTGLVRRVSKAGGEPPVVAAGEKDPRLIVVGSDAVYWSAAAGIRRLAK